MSIIIEVTVAIVTAKWEARQLIVQCEVEIWAVYIYVPDRTACRVLSGACNRFVGSKGEHFSVSPASCSYIMVISMHWAKEPMHCT